MYVYLYFVAFTFNGSPGNHYMTTQKKVSLPSDIQDFEKKLTVWLLEKKSISAVVVVNNFILINEEYQENG